MIAFENICLTLFSQFFRCIDPLFNFTKDFIAKYSSIILNRRKTFDFIFLFIICYICFIMVDYTSISLENVAQHSIGLSIVSCGYCCSSLFHSAFTSFLQTDSEYISLFITLVHHYYYFV